MRLSLAAIILLACALGTAEAQLYKWVDKDGKVTYSDVPPPKDAKDVKQKGYNDNVTPSDELPYAVKDAMKRNPVTLYANACGEPCDKARALLGARGVPFTDRNPETDQSAKDALQEAAGGLSVPTLTIGGRVIKGFADSEWHDALTSSGYPRTNPGVRAKPATPAVPAAPGTAASSAAPATPATPAPAK
ncbi:MAG: glutaredoxin family protein [Betaproteobacteria bacterium]